MIKVLLFLSILTSLLTAADTLTSLRSELAAVKEEYQQKYDSLKLKTVQRWRVRESFLDESSEAESASDELRQELADLYSRVSLYREENYSLKNSVDESAEKKLAHSEQYRFTRETVLKHLTKSESEITSQFPVNQQERMKYLTTKFSTDIEKKTDSEIIETLVDHHLFYLTEGSRVSAKKSSLIFGENELVDAYIVRFGNLFAYALEQNEMKRKFYLSGGDGGHQNFSWKDISLYSDISNIEREIETLYHGGQFRGILPVDLTNQKFFQTMTKENNTVYEKIRDLIKKGGITMYPLTAVLIWALIIIAAKLFYFSMYHLRTVRTRRKTVKLLRKNALSEIRSFLSERKDSLALIASICIHNKTVSRDDVEERVREELMKESPNLEKGLGTLAVLASTAPLLGLFGTVTGMIRMFDTITRFGTGDPKLLAGGISEALVTTEVGLAIAIPLLLIHNFLRNRKLRIIADIEIVAVQLLNRIYGEQDE